MVPRFYTTRAGGPLAPQPIRGIVYHWGMGTNVRNPFKPGPGRRPPLRVGHAYTARYLEDALGSIRDGEDGDIVILYGPRGNGKTALLAEMQARAAEQGIGIVEFGKTAGSEGGKENWILSGPDLPKEESTTRSIGGGLRFLQANHEVTQHAPSDFDRVIRSLVEDFPVLLLVDEANTLPRSIGSGLLHSIQRFVKEGRPLFALLAGTPAVLDHLRDMGASFIERSTSLPVGRLESESDVLDALAIPARKSGLPMDRDALEPLAAECQLYPFFLQMLGHSAWDIARTRGHDSITLDDAKEGISAAFKRREEFYRARHRELVRLKMVDEAVLVSRAMAGKGKDPLLSEKEMAETLSAAAPLDEAVVLEITDKLLHVGLIWWSSGKGWEPGIPSLCAYICERAK